MKLAIMNAVVMICLTALAIHFNHWWIILFFPLLAFWEQ